MTYCDTTRVRCESRVPNARCCREDGHDGIHRNPNGLRRWSDNAETKPRRAARDLKAEVAKAGACIEAAAVAAGLTVHDLLGECREAHVVAARHAAMAEARAATDLSYPELGRLFRRDHATVMAAVGAYKRQPKPAPKPPAQRVEREKRPVCDLKPGDRVRWLGCTLTVVEAVLEEGRVVVRYDAGQPIRYCNDEAVDMGTMTEAEVLAEVGR